MELLVRDNLEKARRGGVPGTIATVQAYLNVKLSTPAMTPQTIEVPYSIFSSSAIHGLGRAVRGTTSLVDGGLLLSA